MSESWLTAHRQSVDGSVPVTSIAGMIPRRVGTLCLFRESRFAVHLRTGSFTCEKPFTETNQYVKRPESAGLSVRPGTSKSIKNSSLGPPRGHLICNLASEKRLWKLLLVLLAGLTDFVSIALEETAPWVILCQDCQFFVAP